MAEALDKYYMGIPPMHWLPWLVYVTVSIKLIHVHVHTHVHVHVYTHVHVHSCVTKFMKLDTTNQP